MDLKEYFDNVKGVGVLSTANADGEVDAAIYARPHVMEDGLIAIIMRDRLSHKNIESNPHAVYLFMEEEKRYQGKRLFLEKVREEKDSPMMEEICRRCYPKNLAPEEPRFLVFFNVSKTLPLVGAGQE